LHNLRNALPLEVVYWLLFVASRQEAAAVGVLGVVAVVGAADFDVLEADTLIS
jgi:hypothetical protein